MRVTLHSVKIVFQILFKNYFLNFILQAFDKDNNLDSSIATLPPIALGTDVETPPLETITEAFSTTQMLLKTHILPVIRGRNDTTSYTLVQSYQVTRLVTATKTLPPMEVYQFVPSKTLNEFNTRLEEAGSELHLELDFGDDGNSEDDDDHPSGEINEKSTQRLYFSVHEECQIKFLQPLIDYFQLFGPFPPIWTSQM